MDISDYSFYFKTAAEYEEKVGKLFNSYGQPVEKFEIQFISGETIDPGYSVRLAFIKAVLQPIWKPYVETWSDTFYGRCCY